MGQTPRLVAPAVTVIMDDGSEYEVQTTNYDMLTCERHFRTHKLGRLEDAPLEMTTFLAWHALKREKILPEMSYDAFTVACLSLESRAAAVDPTREDPGAG